MPVISPKPNQERIEAAISDRLSNGDLSRMAELLNVTTARISHKFNPNMPEKPAAIYRALVELWAMSLANPDAARETAADISALVAEWSGAQASPDLASMVCELHSEVGDVTGALIKKASSAQLRKEVIEVAAKATEILKVLPE